MAEYNGKYKDILFDGRWKVVGSDRIYILENIYNHKTITLSQRQIERVIQGLDTVSRIIARTMAEENKPSVYPRCVDNHVKKNWPKIKYRHAKGA